MQQVVTQTQDFENLSLIPAGKHPALGTLKQSDKSVLLKDLAAAAPQALLDKTWEMIWGRWCVYEDICNSK